MQWKKSKSGALINFAQQFYNRALIERERIEIATINATKTRYVGVDDQRGDSSEGRPVAISHRLFRRGICVPAFKVSRDLQSFDRFPGFAFPSTSRNLSPPQPSTYISATRRVGLLEKFGDACCVRSISGGLIMRFNFPMCVFILLVFVEKNNEASLEKFSLKILYNFFWHVTIFILIVKMSHPSFLKKYFFLGISRLFNIQDNLHFIEKKKLNKK